jgi:predicted transcriptional regulator
MQGKGYLKTRKVGKTNYYTPAVAKEDALRYEATCFLQEYVGQETADRKIVLDILKSHRPKRQIRRKAS